MSNDTIKETFTETRHLSRGNSFGTIAQADNIELTVRMEYKPSTGRGSFEFWDKNQDWYAEGGLWFSDGVLTDYDGVFSLPDFVLDWLQTQGVDVSEMRRVMSE